MKAYISVKKSANLFGKKVLTLQLESGDSLTCNINALSLSLALCCTVLERENKCYIACLMSLSSTLEHSDMKQITQSCEKGLKAALLFYSFAVLFLF